MRYSTTLLAIVAGFLSTAAHAETIEINDFFSVGGGPASVSGSISIEETAAFGGGGTYELKNLSQLQLWGFGVSNASPGTITQNNSGSCCGESAILNASNWGTYIIDFYASSVGLTGQDIFGDISNVLGAGDTHIHWYADVEVGYGNGTFAGFDFFNGTVASEAFVVGSNGVYGTSTAGTQPPAVPLPAAGWMMVAALGGLAAAKRRKTA